MREVSKESKKKELPLSGYSIAKILDELFPDLPAYKGKHVGGQGPNDYEMREIDVWVLADDFVRKVESGEYRLKDKHQQERFADIKYFVVYIRPEADKFIKKHGWQEDSGKE